MNIARHAPLAARGQNPPGIRAAMHPSWPLRFTHSRCKDNVTFCQPQYTFGGSTATLCVAPRANSPAIHLSSRLAGPTESGEARIPAGSHVKSTRTARSAFLAGCPWEPTPYANCGRIAIRWREYRDYPHRPSLLQAGDRHRVVPDPRGVNPTSSPVPACTAPICPAIPRYTSRLYRCEPWGESLLRIP